MPKFKGFVDYQSPSKTGGKKSKSLGNLPDDKKHEAVESLEEKDSETVMGHEPESGSDEVSDVDKIAESVGLYKDNEPTANSENAENLDEVDVAKQIEENEKNI